MRHADIHPGNVMRDGNHYALVDYDVALLLDDAVHRKPIKSGASLLERTPWCGPYYPLQFEQLDPRYDLE